LIEAELLNDSDATPVEVPAFEGLWGLFVYTLVALPVANVVPESSGEGLFESSLEAFEMATSSLKIGLLVLGYFVAVCAFSQAGILVATVSSITQRTLYEALRGVLIWVFALAVGGIWPDSGAGEKFSLYSLIKLGGFLVLILGIALYNRLFRVPGMKYGGEEPDAGIKEGLLEPDVHSSAITWRA
jgi:hypothetical protein